MNITATWLPNQYGYRLDAAASTGTVTWYRSAYWMDDRTSNVKLGTGTQLFDLTVPLDGATVTYTAIDGASVEETTVTPVSDLPILGPAVRPDAAAVAVTVESQRTQEVVGRPTFYDVLDRHEPYVEPMSPIERTGTMVLRMAHPGGAFPSSVLAALRSLLRSGAPLMLRSTCNDRVEDLAFVVMRWTEEMFGSANEHGPDRKARIEWRAVDPLWGEQTTIAARVWGLVPREFATWGDVAAGVATWGDLVAGT